MAAEKEPAIIYDEAKVPPYTLPDPLVLESGQKVTTPEVWFKQRRPELIKLFETQQYGKSPARPQGMTFAVQALTADALGGKATRKQISDPLRRILRRVCRQAQPLHGPADLLAPGATKPVPVFLGLNFNGNHTIHPDPGIPLPTTWMPDNKAMGVENHRASVKGRGADHASWPVEQILARGYGLATAYYGDIEPDFDGGFTEGVHQLYFKPGQTRPAVRPVGRDRRLGLGLEPGHGLPRNRSRRRRPARGRARPLALGQGGPLGRGLRPSDSPW